MIKIISWQSSSSSSSLTTAKALAVAQEMEESTVVNPAHPSNLSRKIISIAAGEAHTLALTADGKVYSWGRGTFGRLGTGSEEDRHFPVRVSFFGSDDEREDKLKIVGIAAGAYHSLALAGSMDKMKFDSVDLLLVLVYDEGTVSSYEAINIDYRRCLRGVVHYLMQNSFSFFSTFATFFAKKL
ncbi:UNVERIFIED_CONTAM: E3 ubiquitin-protein ligase HERC2 [Sesamum calycinum]|uniref:E3 ubiquitin-protein ligase HERC2 n=1 Tax=Sesamum calycinum TaxID=2727403 RepID=A0AAW2LWU2_9LAMI